MAGSQAITELQEAFGTLLAWDESQPTSTKDPGQYRWTGAFRLFEFPRELRDRIYYHHLYNPEGLVHRRTDLVTLIIDSSCARRFPFEESNHISLFLSRRQVYEEAMLIFCRYNVIEIPYKHQLGGMLRLFPNKPAALLQRIQLVYFAHSSKRDWQITVLGGVWVQIVEDAHTAKAFFPLLRECIAYWAISIHNFQDADGANMPLEGKSEGEKTALLYNWLKIRCEVDRLVPPRWLSVKFRRCPSCAPPPQELQQPFSEALQRIKQQFKGTDNTQEELEVSGEKWLGETYDMSGATKKRRRRKQEARPARLT